MDRFRHASRVLPDGRRVYHAAQVHDDATVWLMGPRPMSAPSGRVHRADTCACRFAEKSMPGREWNALCPPRVLPGKKRAWGVVEL